MSIRLVIGFYFLVAVIVIIEGLSLEFAPLLDHRPVPRNLEYLIVGLGLIIFMNAVFLIRRNLWALGVARFLAGIGLAGLLKLMFHLRGADLFSILVCSLFVAFIWASLVLRKHKGDFGPQRNSLI